jgi:hypothetical protein
MILQATCRGSTGLPIRNETAEPGSAEARGAFGFFDLLGNALP